MRLLRTALFLSSALLPISLSAQTAPPAPAPKAAVQPIAFTERTLPNGLKVYAIRDTSTANVSVQVWYDVGSKDDPKDRSGFAHMFEHLMFKSTRNLVAEQVDRLTEDVGGYNNASTDDDYTNYYEVVPANHLERLLFAESDRMASLVVDPATFASERDVVKEELRSRVLAQPYGKLFYLYLPQISYTTHPYGRPGIGSIADLDAATIDDIRAFHATYYRPDNAILVVSGNFDPAQLDRWIDQYFAGIKKPDRAIPRVTVTEPPRTKATSVTVYEANTPLPAVALSFQLPPDSDADTPAIAVLNTILSGGESSRLYQSLVYAGIAQDADTFISSRKSTGSLAIYAIMAGGKNAETGEAAVRAELAKLRDTPVSAAELAEAKNEILTAAIRSRETAEGKAFSLASSAILNDDPRASDRQLAAIAAVTVADIQRVARKYLNDPQSAAIRYLPVEAKPAGVTGDVVTTPATIVTAALTPPADIKIVVPAPAAERILPPAPGPVVKAAIPAPVEVRLANGMRVVLVEKRGLPIVTASLVVDGGGARDPGDRAGLGSLTAELLTKGTTTRSATDIARAVESLGGSISSGAGWDGASVSLTVKSDEILPAMTILADVVRNPAFAQDELDRARTQAIDAVGVQLKDPGALSGIVASRAVFGARPYGQMLGGTPISLKAITRADVLRAYGNSWRPEAATLVLVGDIGKGDATALAEKLFGDWKGGDISVRTGPVVPLPAPRVIVVDLPGSGQAGVVIAKAGITREDKDYYAAMVANATLGVGFSSRLNQEIRIKRGLAYGAGSSVDARLNPGPISARTQTKNPSAPEVVAIILAEMAKLGTAPVPAAELDARKAVLIGGFGRSIETTGGIAGILVDYSVKRVPLDELQTFVPKVEAVDAAAVQKAAARLLGPDGASIVVVGDAKLFADDLRKTYPTLEVIPAASLDLDKPALK